MSYITMELTPPPGRMEAWLAETEAKIVAMGMDAPKVIAGSVADKVMPAIRDQTPILTGALADNTQYTRESVPEGERIVVFSTAANVRTGYNYARARAYGFVTRAGTSWEPPEQPQYPIQGVLNAGLTDMSIYAPKGG
ncbi:MAG: hypothetical protein LC754_10320 [Acidobacteria bacterium]|nr:hypothetical protein [Acidobacteriota bacterium]